MKKLDNESYLIGWIECSFAVHKYLSTIELERYLFLCKELNHKADDRIQKYIDEL